MACGRLATFLTVAALIAGCSRAAAPTSPTATNRPCIVTVSLVAPVGVPGTSPLVCSSPGSSCSISFPPEGRQSTVYVETAAACAWTAASDQGWTTVAPSAGSGPGTATISVSANPAGTRASHVTIATTTIGVGAVAPVTITVMQSGAS